MSLARLLGCHAAPAVLAAYVLLALTGCSGGGDGSSPTTRAPSATTGTGTPSSGAPRIVIKGYAFHPADLRVSPGQKVTVVNQDSVVHTVTATGSNAFDTGTIPAGGTSSFTAPSKTGDHAYICTIHPNMQATLTVR